MNPNAAKEAAKKMMPKNTGPFFAIVKAALGIGVLGYAGYNSVHTVEGGHRAIKFSRFGGIGSMTYGEGLLFVIPWLERPIIYDVRTRPRNLQSLTGSKDLQMVNLTLRVLSKPDPNNLHFIYRRLGIDYDERVLPSIVNEVSKSVVARYNASELLTKREAVSREVASLLTKRARDFGILLDDVSITHLSFSREYTAAVEAKQVAQQDAERAKYVVDKAIQEKRSIILKAQGEAQSAELVGKAIRDNPGFVQLRMIDAARDISTIVAKSTNRVYLNADNLLLNTLGISTSTKKK
eukprot:CAMPEP_0113940856 /NCGR_PEP_ID=MMETSP1339-20121228/6898_1 /TAXON_ID=94617 /ORGANISM="Fibrocapsa japonica" /LENGTH=293 /DNA_ID=CAMNT_0000944819 /DNA_START=46 /DNA_END=927 /DNA_ORIENTATION=+ /assembly_acc=CAM_ASM_000762